MPFLGKTPTVGNFILLDSITVSNTATFALTKDSLDYYPGSAQNMIVSVNGVTQAPLTAYTITDNNIVFASALDSDTDVIDYILVLGDTLNIGRPSDSTVGATQLQDYAVTSVKMSNTGVGAATYGTSTSIPQITIDAAGRITSATGIDRSNQFEDLTVTGNLTVSGNTVTVDAQTLSVEDPLIHLAANNETSDVVDIGFVGHYSNDGGTTKLHTGFFRDASDEQYYLFNGFEDATLDLSNPATTIDRTASTFTLATLNVGDLNITSTTDIDTGLRIKQFVANNVADGDYNLFADASRDADLRLYDYTNSTDILYFDKGTTHVGIGINSPSAKLDVRQEKTGGGVLVQVYNTDNSDTTTQTAGLALGPDTRGATARITAVKENADFSTNAGRDVALTFSSVLNNSPTERMRITSAGEVGIGTDSPSNRFTVNANTGSTPTVYINNGSPNATEGLALKVQASGRGSGIADVSIFSVHNNANELFTVRNDGNVGIGTTSPAVNLHVNSASDTYLLMSTSNATADNRILFRNSAGTDAGGLWYATNNNSMQFRTNSAERMRIDGSGTVGVAVTPHTMHASYDGIQVQNSLWFTNNSNFSGFTQNAYYDGSYKYSTSNEASLFRQINGRFDFVTAASGTADNAITFDTVMQITNSGNVGIGTGSASVEQKLHISDSTNVTYTADETSRVAVKGTSMPGIRLTTSNNGSNTIGLWMATGTTVSGTHWTGISGNRSNAASGWETHLSFFAHPFATSNIDNANEIMRITGNGPVLFYYGENWNTSTPGTTQGSIHINPNSSTDHFGGAITFGASDNASGQNAQAGIYVRSDGSYGTKMYFATTDSYATGPKVRATFDHYGSFIVGETDAISAGDEAVQIGQNGAITTARNQTSDQTHIAFLNPNGQVGRIRTLTTGTAYVTSSDERLKENIVNAPAGNIDDIRIRSFDWIVDGSHQTYGIVAQELVSVAPEAVSQSENDDEMWGVDYSKLVPMMIKEIQDLKAEVAALRGA